MWQIASNQFKYNKLTEKSIFAQGYAQLWAYDGQYAIFIPFHYR